MVQKEVGRPIKINGMAYGPTNEQGVVYLFGRLAPHLGFHVETVRTRFPDCIARRRGRACQIEFEYRASQYELHDHPPRGADVVVCWENDWEHRPRKYQHLEIIALKQFVGALPRVFSVGWDKKRVKSRPDKLRRIHWSAPANTQVGDLILLYRKAPAAEIGDLWRVVGPFSKSKEFGVEAGMRLVVRLRRPVTFDQLKSDPYTRKLSVVRKRFQGRSDITEQWPQLYKKITNLNPHSKAALHEYRPD